VHMDTAVMGVKGTVFGIDAAADKSAEISVYEGEVFVAGPAAAGGPSGRTSLKALQKLKVSSTGIVSAPWTFDPKTEDQEWQHWNQERDALPDSGPQPGPFSGSAPLPGAPMPPVALVGAGVGIPVGLPTAGAGLAAGPTNAVGTMRDVASSPSSTRAANGPESAIPAGVQSALTKKGDFSAKVICQESALHGGAVTLKVFAESPKKIAGYFLSMNRENPSGGDTGWIAVSPAPAFSKDIVFRLKEGKHGGKIYLWLKDAEGHMSARFHACF